MTEIHTGEVVLGTFDEYLLYMQRHTTSGTI